MKVVQAMETFYRKLSNQPIPKLKSTLEWMSLWLEGLGSSATAIVSGLVGADELAGQPFFKAINLLTWPAREVKSS
jgi:homoserine kinase